MENVIIETEAGKINGTFICWTIEQGKHLAIIATENFGKIKVKPSKINFA